MSHFAILFPGQGSQSVGMMSALAENHAEIKQYFDSASELLDYDLWQLVQQDPEQQLNQTEYTQPALLVAGVAYWQVWREQNPLAEPAFLAGHSLGEYSALVCAQALAFDDAVKLVALRGQLMQQAVPAGQGAMAAIIGLDDATVAKVCDQAAEAEVVTCANFNAVGQVVISGHSAAVERAMQLAKEAGAKLVKALALSVPSHCPLMQTAANNLQQALTKIEIKMPKIPVIHNASVQNFTDADEIKKALVEQLSCSVRWVESVQHMQQAGVERVYECGPGKVLTGLSKRIDRKLKAASITEYTEGN